MSSSIADRDELGGGQERSSGSTTTAPGGTGPAEDPSQRQPHSGERTPRRTPWLLELYGSALGKKYAMALSGIVMMGFVVAHTIGNLKLYVGPEAMDTYGEWLRDVGYPALPHSGLLWILRLGLIVALLVHLHAAWALTRMNRRARPVRYQSKRDYVAADFAARTMRWTGIIVLLFIAFHLGDLTFGVTNTSAFTEGAVYANTVASFSRPAVSIFYIIANLALAYHLYHGAWSMFQSLGLNNRRFNHWRRYFAIGFAAVVVVPNISFPIAVLTGVVA